MKYTVGSHLSDAGKAYNGTFSKFEKDAEEYKNVVIKYIEENTDYKLDNKEPKLDKDNKYYTLILRKK